jgi:hypothetical protein
MASMRREISETWAQTLELAKWKLVTVGAVSVVGLGWGDLKPENDTGVLLLYSIGFLCTYIDLLIYRRLVVIHVIAGYLRKYNGEDLELKEEKLYEHEVERIRGVRKLPLSERWGHFLSSLVFTIGPVLLAFIRYCTDWDFRLAIPILALILNISLFIIFELSRRGLRESA